MIATLQPASPALRGFRRAYAAIAPLVLLVPAVAMLLTGEVNWGPGDFIVAGGLLALLGIGIDGALRLPASLRLRAGIACVAVLAFLLVWAELAVGIFD